MAASYDALHRVTRYRYDPNGNLIQLTDANGNTTGWEYDGNNRVTRKIFADNSSYSYAYDPAGNLLFRTDGKGQITQYSYDAQNNLTKIHYPMMPEVNFAYDALNRRSQMADGIGTTTYGYDAASRLKSVDGPWADDTITYEYNALGQRTTMTVAGGASLTPQTVGYGYDALDRLSNVVSVAGTFLYLYRGAGALLDHLFLPNGAQVNYSYDPLNRLQQIANVRSDNSVISSFAYTYDNADLRTSETRADGEVIHYDYDLGYELASALSTNQSPTTKYQYWYDAMGNRLQENRNGALLGAQHNNLNQLTTQTDPTQIRVSGQAEKYLQTLTVAGQIITQAIDKTFVSQAVTLVQGTNVITTIGVDVDGNSTTNQTSVIVTNVGVSTAYGYDLNGNMTNGIAANGQPMSLTYDDENRLASITVGANQYRFVYDGTGRRVSTKHYQLQGVDWTLVSETRFVYDGFSIVQERDTNNAIQVQYTRGKDLSGSMQAAGGIGGLLSLTSFTGSPSSAYYFYNGRGDVTDLADSIQSVVAHYEYDPFGRLTVATGTLDQPYRFSTKEYDELSGLVYFGSRFYSPEIGRWPNRDPIGELDGLSLYRFVYNTSLNIVDPFGLQATVIPPSGPAGGILIPGQMNGVTQLRDPFNVQDINSPLNHGEVCSGGVWDVFFNWLGNLINPPPAPTPEQAAWDRQYVSSPFWPPNDGRQYLIAARPPNRPTCPPKPKCSVSTSPTAPLPFTPPYSGGPVNGPPAIAVAQ